MVSQKSKDKIPYTTINGVHDNRNTKEQISWWTNGFWPGMMWLMYVATKDEKYKEVAENAEKMLDAALFNYDGLHHDVGFMWNISSGVNYRLTGNKESKKRLSFATDLLAARYNTDAYYLWRLFLCRGDLQTQGKRYALLVEVNSGVLISQ